MFSLRTHAFIFFGILGAIMLLAIAGNVAEAYGVPRPPPGMQTLLKVVFLGLVVALGISFIPLMVKFVLQGQIWAGNQDRPFIKSLIEHQATIVFVLWGIIGAGLLIAIPTAIKDGFLSGEAANTTTTTQAESEGPNLGALVARPGMTVDEMTKLSSLKPQRMSNPYASGTSSAIAGGGGNFEFEVAGTGFKFEGCRYYFVSTYTNDPGRIESISIGTSHAKLSRIALDKANAELQARLAADGWLTGREEYRTEEDRTLHDGQPRGEEGWL